jgi:hypothetical protein
MAMIKICFLGTIGLVTLAGCGEDGGTGSGAASSSSASASASASGTGGAGQGGGGVGAGGSGGEGGGGTGGVASCSPIDLAGASEEVSMPAGCTGPMCTSVGWKPLTDLVGGAYRGVPGGLYCDSNARPAEHDAKGLAVAKAIEPLDAQGQPSPNGKYAFISIGMSNTTQEFSTFQTSYEADPSIDPRLVIVDGALGAHATKQWIDPQNDAWTNLTMRLTQKNVTDGQVVAAWVKLAQGQPQPECDSAGFNGEPCFPADAKRLGDDIQTILGMLKARFTNLSLIYLSSRIYAGYATGPLNPEPYAYQSGFAVKRIILDQITKQPGSEALPWLAWGPYLWADGTTPRSDGLVWEIGDFAPDGVHPSNASGRKKVADMIWEFLTTDATAREWFLAAP